MTTSPVYRTVGNSGLVVSGVGLGCNNLGRAGTPTETQEGTDAVIEAAVDSGITLFDVADVYGKTPGTSERMFGQALKALGRDAEDVVVVSKFGMDMRGVNGTDHGARGARRYVHRALDSSLSRLGRDHIDLYFYHTPDGVTPPEETLAALDDAVRAGKVRYVGTSNHAGWQIADADHLARANGGTRYVAAENHYNLLDRRAELEVLPAAERFGIGLLPYFPLANGLLTGKYRHGQAPDGSRLSHSKKNLLESTDWDQIERFVSFAEDRELTPIQVAFSWLASRPQVTSVIAGATTPEQVRSNAVAASWVPTSEDLEELDRIFPPPEKIALF
ncbi:aldo/keto reductase [Kocuria sp. HSID16901]|uniref:aldo/keto reductase n=1 Tax=Kocuria sp. HSID16901 TaxID=2419505 RepID=UPI00065F8A0E|nr:aldo/keto reductase [Kocuria sp. HSID16901]MCT1366897.1 aldo/keto reductase [Rothia sp. p3-SID1597]RUQ20714.1 aldo/keto reductase [Kocuria sp. HSID16901]